MNIRKIYILLFTGTLLIFLATSCSTKKNKWNRRVYHNLTGHYNAYFNGNEALKVAVKDISLAHVDDYTEVLDVFPLGTPEVAMASVTDLDRTIMKASLVVHNHSMYFGKEEKVKWVYYSYLLMGKARFYKQEYGTAKQIFRYVITKYPNENVKQDAQLWIALIASIEGDYESAISQLDAIKNKVSSGAVSKESYRMLPLVYADVYVRMKNYEAAIPYLKLGIDRANKKKEKARLYFILGQLQQEQKKFKPAIQQYLQVLKKNPTYEMDFNARMNMAKCYEGGDSRVVMKQLSKMLKDIKNDEYQDQIYYVMAGIALKEKKKPLAIDYLQLSVQKSVSNDKQKAFSALKLAEIYFDDEKYTNAQAYYDSTMLFLPKDYPDYNTLNNRKVVLTELVTNLVIIQTEDSLQNLANMPEGKRNKLIEGYIAAEIQAEQLAAKLEQERLANLQFLQQNRGEEKQLESVTNKGAVAWYFYNPNQVSSGYSEFVAKWGNRKLTDNWRLSDKQIISFDNPGDDENPSEDGEEVQQKTQKSSNKKTKEYYLANVPLTQSDMDSSNARIEKALFEVALVYKEKLFNTPKAKESFDELLRRFPAGTQTDQAYYNLYRIYIAEGNNGDARFYKNKLIKEFPDSDYAKILQDPDYFSKLAQEANKIKIFYKETYQLYSQKQYAKVQANCVLALTQYPNNSAELSRFEMLNALCVGSSRDTVAFIAALQKVVNTYPDSEVKPKAESMIALLQISNKANNKGDKNGESSGNTGDQKNDFTPSIYVYNASETHMFLVLADKRSVQISELKNRISDHNSKYFGTENLTVSAIPINENILLIGVSNFKDEKKALEYFQSARRNSLLYVMLKKNGGNFFIISEGNYSRLYRSKDLDGYRKFSEQHYPAEK